MREPQLVLNLRIRRRLVWVVLKADRFVLISFKGYSAREAAAIRLYRYLSNDRGVNRRRDKEKYPVQTWEC